MTQNNYDLDYQAINLANSNKKYVINKQESKSHKRAKKLKIVNKFRFALSIGIVTICISGLSLNFINSNNNAEAVSKTYNAIEFNIDDNKTLNLSKNETIQNEYIDKYCDIYGLKSDVVKQIYSKNKEYFNSINYLKTSGFKNYNEELEALTFVRHLYQVPSDFNVNKDAIIDNNATLTNEINEETLVKYYSDLFNIDPVLVLAIEYQESSNKGERYASDVYNLCNNPAGLMNDGETFWVFPSKEAGIIEHIYQLKKYYIDKGLTTPEQIKTIYAPDFAENDPNNYNLYWVDNVNSLMKEIRNNPDIFNDVDNNKKI